MITTSGLRNAFWSAIAFGIVACATAPVLEEKTAEVVLTTSAAGPGSTANGS